MTKTKICFLADKHSLFDDRIYWKMAVPLTQKGFEVHYILIGEDSKKGITNEGIKYEIFKLKTFSKNRYLNYLLKRLNPSNNFNKIFKSAKVLKADIYHFHGLWLNKIGGKLKDLNHNPIVFYDAREPYAKDYKSYLKSNNILKNKIILLFASHIDRWEKNKSKKYNLIISNEDFVRDQFRKHLGINKAETLFNYTDIYENYKETLPINKEYDFIYLGSITEQRGITKILEAVNISKEKHPTIKVAIVGKYAPEDYKKTLQDYIDKHKLNKNVYLFDQIPYTKVSEFYNKSKVGIVVLQPIETFKICMPIKVFEYMAFGLPIIGSDFGHIKKYIETDNCGITVDPTNEKEISLAMNEFIENDNKLSLFAKNGREATLKKYKWDFELERLIGFYTKFLNERTNKK